jgi:hypothetical protein
MRRILVCSFQEVQAETAGAQVSVTFTELKNHSMLETIIT